MTSSPGGNCCIAASWINSPDLPMDQGPLLSPCFWVYSGKSCLLFPLRGSAVPTYEYECRACGHSFERTQSMSEDPVKDCPECGKDVRRVINGGAGIIFKGSGFYVNDSKSKSSATTSSQKTNSQTGDASGGDVARKPSGDSASPAASTPASTGSRTEARTESKSEAKTESKSEAKSGTKESA